jgi:hypothetical protein
VALDRTQGRHAGQGKVSRRQAEFVADRCALARPLELRQVDPVGDDLDPRSRDGFLADQPVARAVGIGHEAVVQATQRGADGPFTRRQPVALVPAGADDPRHAGQARGQGADDLAVTMKVWTIRKRSRRRNEANPHIRPQAPGLR